MSNAVRLIEIKEEIHADNERVAQNLRSHVAEKKTFLLNVMPSPGSGKTQTIPRTIDTLRDRLRRGVMEADVDSAVDAELIASRGIGAVQLRTGGFCHLDAAADLEPSRKPVTRRLASPESGRARNVSEFRARP